MKKFAIALGIISNVAFAQSVKVTGCGDSYDAAKNDAFKNAVEFQVGSVLVTQSESKNSTLTRNDILKYSSGYIDRFVVIDYSKQGSKDCVYLEAWVSTSKIADRIMGVMTEPKKFDGENFGARYETWMESKKNGDKLLNSLLKDYPSNAFTIKQERTNFGVDGYRQTYIDIEYQIRWNYNYIESFRDTVKLLADGDNGMFAKNPAEIVVMAKNPKDLLFGRRDNYPFSNIKTTAAIKEWVNENSPAIKLEIYNKSFNIIYTGCYTPAKFTNYAPSRFHSVTDQITIINGNEVESGYIRLDRELSSVPLRSIEKIELSIVGQECWKNNQKPRF